MPKNVQFITKGPVRNQAVTVYKMFKKYMNTGDKSTDFL